MLHTDIIEQRVQLGFTPHEHQFEVAGSMAESRFSVLVCHRRWGKTFLAVATLFNAALRYKPVDANPGMFGYIAPYLKQAKRAAWKYVNRFANEIPGTRVLQGEHRVIFPNGNEISLFGGDNPDALRGEYMHGVVLDELADMRATLWTAVVRPMLMDYKGWAFFIGTPRGHDLLFELFNKALANPRWFAGIFSVDQTNLIDESELEQAREDMTDALYRQEMLCDFSASIDNAMITIDAVVRAAARRAPKAHELAQMPRTLGVDVARYGDDRSVIQRRIGPLAMSPQVFRDIDNVQLAGYVMKAINDFKPDATFIDGGRGEGVIDICRNNNYDVQEIHFGGKSSDPHFKDKRSEMYGLMSDWIDEHGVLPDETKEDRELRADLVVPTYRFSAGTDLIQLESKDSIKERVMRSPDCSDALALTFAHPVLRSARKGKTRKAYDPIERLKPQRSSGRGSKRTPYNPWQARESGLIVREPGIWQEAA